MAEFQSSVPATPPSIPPVGYVKFDERSRDANAAAELLQEDERLRQIFKAGDNSRDLEDQRDQLEKQLFTLAGKYGLDSIENLSRAILNTDPYIE
ncbi:MAG TPA: hypothetical protein VLE93_00515 [Candidatus Saccharimonadales bacterium]|nr:hypothetical protein [Candidatus Saccharimonadales bacterium]